MGFFSTSMILVMVVCFNTTLFTLLGLYLWRQGAGQLPQQGGSGGERGM
jgi:hypothetical protein